MTGRTLSTSILLIVTVGFMLVAGVCRASVRVEPRLARSVQDSIKKASRVSPLKGLRDDIVSLLSAPELTTASIGIHVSSVENGEMLIGIDSDKYFNPASVQKLVTTSAALSLLKPDYRFLTTVYLDGVIGAGGRFEGNIVIRGSADPTISSVYGVDPEAHAERIASILDSIGIHSIRGSIIGDDDFLDDVEYGPGWSWDDLMYSYAAQVSGLSIANNSVQVALVGPLTVQELATVRISPVTDYLRVISAVRTVDTTGVTEVRPYRDLTSNQMVDLVGTVVARIPADTVTMDISVNNPTLYYLNFVRDALMKRGIRFRGALIDVDEWHEQIPYDSLTLIGQVTSDSLGAIIKVINRFSHNLGAESLFKTMGKELGQEGSFLRGAEVVKTWLQKANAQGGSVIADGSGLSRFNLNSPRQVCMLLNYMYQSEYRREFVSSLAVPGEPGTLKRRMVNSRAERAVHAKTGSMNNVSSLAGYVVTKDGEQLAFCILMNNVVAPLAVAQNLQDLICMRLASFSRK